jgi:nucleotide-binding universal stress UspA family protein
MHTGAALGAQIGAVSTRFFVGPRIRLVFSALPLIGALLVIWELFGGVGIAGGHSGAKTRMNVLVFFMNMPYAAPAVRFGGLIARLTGGSITLLMSTRDPSLREAADEELVEAAAQLPDLQVETRVSRSSAIEGIWDEIHTGGYDMVVMRARRAIRFRKRLGAKLGRQVAVESPISVLVVKDSEKPPELRRLLICTGGKDPGNLVIERGAELAKASGASITLLHVTNPVPSMYTGMGEIEETLTELLQTDTPTAKHLRRAAAYLADKNIESNLVIRQGDVTEEILAEARTGGSDLIVIGAARGESRLIAWVMGDVTRSLVNHASCAVLVVR